MTTAAVRPQHMEALDRANEIRIARADLKRKIKSGEVRLVDILKPGRAIPDSLEAMTIFDLLSRQRLWGTKRTSRFLNALEIYSKKPVADLSDDQRRALVSALSAKAARRARELGST